MTARHRQLLAAFSIGIALALLVSLGATALSAAGAATLRRLTTPTPPIPPARPAAASGQLPIAGIGLPRAVATPCNRFASPSGSDSSPGSLRAPFQTVQRLVNSLRPGQTGCLRAGTYIRSVRIARGGLPSARITLTAYPGETATIMGRVEIIEGADYVTVTGLRLNGANPGRLPSPMVDANHVTFSYDDVTDDHTGICFGIGSASWGWATDTLITHDRVHDCGQPQAFNLQHGFYVGAATGTRIEWSLIYANAARGIQLYPDAQHTTIDHDIIDDNAEGIMISGEGGQASSYTNVYDNIISNATVRHDVESFWPAGNPVGVENVVHDNCVWRGRQGTIYVRNGGLAANDNARVNPQFVDAHDHNYTLKPTSRCLFVIGDVEAAVDGTRAVTPVFKLSPFVPGTLPGPNHHLIDAGRTR